MVSGDKVWRANVWSSIDLLEDIDRFFTEGEFGGWFTLQGSKKNAWLKCPYDGGFEVSTESLFKTKKDAQKAAAPEVLRIIEKHANFLKKQLKELDKEAKKWQILAND